MYRSANQNKPRYTRPPHNQLVIKAVVIVNEDELYIYIVIFVLSVLPRPLPPDTNHQSY